MSIKKVSALTLALAKLSALAPIALNIEFGGETQKQNRGLLRLGGFITVYESDKTVGFINPYLLTSYDDVLRKVEKGHHPRFSFELNVGAGFRHKINNQCMFGLSAFYDIKDSAVLGTKDERVKNYMQSITIATELFIKDSVAFRLNAYLPIIKSEFALNPEQLRQISANYNPETNTTTIGKRVQLKNSTLVTVKGVEAEVTFNTNSIIKNSHVGLQGFGFGLESKDTIYYGAKLKLQYDFNNMFAVKGEAEFNNQKNMKIRLLANVKLASVGQKQNTKNVIDKNFYNFVQRDIDIKATVKKDSEFSSPVIENGTKDEIYEGLYIVVDNNENKIIGNAVASNPETKEALNKISSDTKVMFVTLEGDKAIAYDMYKNKLQDEAGKKILKSIGENDLFDALQGTSIKADIEEILANQENNDESLQYLKATEEDFGDKKVVFTDSQIKQIGLAAFTQERTFTVDTNEDEVIVDLKASNATLEGYIEDNTKGATKLIVKFNEDSQDTLIEVTKVSNQKPQETKTILVTSQKVLNAIQQAKDTYVKKLDDTTDKDQLTENQLISILRDLRNSEDEDVASVAKLLMDIESSVKLTKIYEKGKLRLIKFLGDYIKLKNNLELDKRDFETLIDSEFDLAKIVENFKQSQEEEVKLQEAIKLAFAEKDIYTSYVKNYIGVENRSPNWLAYSTDSEITGTMDAIARLYNFNIIVYRNNAEIHRIIIDEKYETKHIKHDGGHFEKLLPVTPENKGLRQITVSQKDGENFKNVTFLIGPVPGDGSCGYHALEVKRVDVHNKLLEKADELEYRQLLAPGIMNYYNSVSEEERERIIGEQIKNKDGIIDIFKSINILHSERSANSSIITSFYNLKGDYETKLEALKGDIKVTDEGNKFIEFAKNLVQDEEATFEELDKQ
jgi:hypothetical protein